jgi:DNA polymerase III subunit delta'
VVSAAFAALVGQPQAVELLAQAIARQRLAPAYLFAGPNGVGRSLAARSFLAAILKNAGGRLTDQRLAAGNHPDLLWVEPTYLQQGKLITRQALIAKGEALPKTRPQIRLEQIREIARFLSRPPLEASRSLVVLEQAETMAEGAANGLLKTLEEPGQASLILIAPGEVSLLPTLVSRCQRIPFYRLQQPQMQQVLKQASYEAILEYPQLIQMAQGSPGAAIAHWQQYQALDPELLQTCLQLPSSVRAALERGRQISQTLDLEAQLWLVDYLQHAYWQQQRQPALLQVLEQTRQHLLGYAQPQLVWEVNWMSLLSEIVA